MARIVDEAYIEDLCEWIKGCDEQCEITMSRVLSEVKEDLENMPNAVFCKDCEFCGYNSSSETYKCRCMNGMYRTVKPDDFCSYGEMKCDEI